MHRSTVPLRDFRSAATGCLPGVLTVVGVQDEAYMLPVLLRFNGTVDVVTLPGGEPAILYRFPELQRRAALPALATGPSALAGTQSGFRKAVGKAASWIQELKGGGAGGEELQKQNQDSFVAYAGEGALPPSWHHTTTIAHRFDFQHYPQACLSTACVHTQLHTVPHDTF